MVKGTCYLVGTPIGNLEDMTYRAVRILGEVDLIAAEDTRNTVKLLNHFSIKNKMISYHQHNERERSGMIIEQLNAGKSIAVVSDAGMPCISDPGYEIVKRCISEEIPLIAIPGPSALLGALVVSGLNTREFYFGGFISQNNKERRSQFLNLRLKNETIIIYESPHKLNKTLKDIQNELGERKIAVVRELTKKYEEVIRGDISQAIEHFDLNEPKGEFVIVIEGLPKEDKDINDWENITYEEHLNYYLKQNYEKKDAVKLIAKDRGLPKKIIYEYFMKK